ncbi:MAG TPA: oligosaccharide flippase family protein [Pyrinomonadaceae bacterium]|nr:oligosaccharide flippase family protein [Acidobacteriota bacterium]HQZ96568.1 oligosaccharide flippase family protein [Pyrinomonadaceae bacterium]
MKNEDTKTQSLKEQGAWLLVAKIIAFGFSFALPLLIVRFMPLNEVGHYREAFQIITNALVILPLGFSMSAYYFLAREKERRGAAVLNILLFNFVVGGLAALTLFLYPQLLGGLTRSEELTRLGPAIGIVIWIWIFSTFLETVAIANSEAKAATYFIVFASFSKTLLMGGAVLGFATVEAFIYASMIHGVIQTAILLNYLRSRFPGFWRDFDPAFFREQMRYAIPFGLTAILWTAQTDIHNYFVFYKFTAADFAIYAYGCFQLPLISMLAESISSVLIPRMNALQQVGEREEMLRLTVRATQKLAFFYFPIYAFLMITAETFVLTLFTKEYLQSTPIFMINLTLIPLSILVTDPIVRSYKELGRFFLLTRIFVLTLLIGVLYFWLDHFSLTGVITVAVAALVLEKVIGESMVIKKLGLGWKDLPLLKDVGKVAVITLFAGLITYIVYVNVHVYVEEIGERLAQEAFTTNRASTLNFVGGSLVLLISGLVFAPIYLLGANFWGVIEEADKRSVMNLIRKFLPKQRVAPLVDLKN